MFLQGCDPELRTFQNTVSPRSIYCQVHELPSPCIANSMDGSPVRRPASSQNPGGEAQSAPFSSLLVFKAPFVPIMRHKYLLHPVQEFGTDKPVCWRSHTGKIHEFIAFRFEVRVQKTIFPFATEDLTALGNEIDVERDVGLCGSSVAKEQEQTERFKFSGYSSASCDCEAGPMV